MKLRFDKVTDRLKVGTFSETQCVFATFELVKHCRK